MTPVEDVVFAPGLHAWQCICGHVNDLRSAAETTCDACGSTEVAGSGGTCVVTAVDRGAGVVTLGRVFAEELSMVPDRIRFETPLHPAQVAVLHQHLRDLFDAMTVDQAREIQSWESGQRGIADECVKRGWIPEDWNFQWSGEQIEFQADDLQGPKRKP